jgi:hypothetical protein
MSKYKVGDKVLLKSYEKIKKLSYKLGISISPYRSIFCGGIYTVRGEFSGFQYLLKEDYDYYVWHEDMIIGKVNDIKFKKLKEIL